MANQQAVIEVKNLQKHYSITRGFFRRTVGQVKAVDDVSFQVARGETLALVGESGCGKTTTGRCVVRAIEPTAGEVLFHKYRGRQGSDGQDPDSKGNSLETINITALERAQLRYEQRYLGMIFQDPFSSLNPRMTVLESIAEPFVTRNLLRKRRDLEERVAALLEAVRLDPDYMYRYPHAFSGGQRQRIAIARALALNPQFIVADEPVSALDVSVQAQILSLLKELQQEQQLTYLFITHNLAVVEYISDRVAVMYVGKIVELGETETLFAQPRHPYTEALLSAVPHIETDDKGRTRERILLEGDVADPANVPTGCSFHPRCPYAQSICQTEEPPLINIAPADAAPHYARCHFATELELQGVQPRKAVPLPLA